MRRWQVAVATENPKILYLVVRLLKRMKTRFVMCAPEDFKTYNAKIVVTTLEESERIAAENQLLVAESFDADRFTIDLQSRLCDVNSPRNAFIGIDPGMTYGIALVIQGCPVFQACHTSPHETKNRVSTLLAYMEELFPECDICIRVGSGSKLFAALILRELSGFSKDVSIEMVNEAHTSLSGGPNADMFSAIIIAGRSGRPASEQDRVLEAKPGDIRSLKSLVSRITPSKRKITSKDARRIIEDGLSLDTFLNGPRKS